MMDLTKLQAFVEATGLHAAEGVEFGMHAGDVAKIILAVGVALHVQAHGTPATIEALRKQADNLDEPDGSKANGAK